jgi:hypothetical protein
MDPVFIVFQHLHRIPWGDPASEYLDRAWSASRKENPELGSVDAGIAFSSEAKSRHGISSAVSWRIQRRLSSVIVRKLQNELKNNHAATMEIEDLPQLFCSGASTGNDGGMRDTMS